MGYDIGSSKHFLIEQASCFRKVFDQVVKMGKLNGKTADETSSKPWVVVETHHSREISNGYGHGWNKQAPDF